MAEGLTLGSRPDSAGHVHFGRGHVIPECIQRLPIHRIAGLQVVVGSATTGIHRADRVSFKLGACGKWSSTEHVDGPRFGQVQALVSLEDVAGQIELSLVTSDPVQLNETELDFGVSGNNRLLGRWAIIRHQKIVHETDAGVEQSAVAGSAIVGDRSLQHMPNVVKFVAGGLCLREHALGLAVVHVVCVEVSTGLLNRDDLGNHFFRHGPQLGTVTRLKRESDTLSPFVNVGVGIDRSALCRRTLAHQAAEIVHAAVRFQEIVHGGNALGDIDLAPLSPKSALHGYSPHGNISQLGMW